MLRNRQEHTIKWERSKERKTKQSLRYKLFVTNNLKILFFLFLLNNLCLAAQTNDTINNSQVFILGIKEFNEPVFMYPKNKKPNEKKIPIELCSVVMEKERMKSFITTKERDFKYISLDSNCYIIGLWGTPIENFVQECIIPIVSEEYLLLLNKIYSKSSKYGEIRNTYGSMQKYNKKYEYRNVLHHKFIAILIHAPLYNNYTYHCRPPAHRFRENKAEQGIYLKLLIPVLDDE